MTRNLCIDYIRIEKRFSTSDQVVEISLSQQAVQHSTGNPQQTLAAARQIEAIRKELHTNDDFSTQCRQAMDYYIRMQRGDDEIKSNSDIARLMDIEYKHVNVIIHRCLNKLRLIIDAC